MFSTESGKIDHHLSVFIPPKPNKITKKVYGCGKHFITQSIEHLFVLNNTYYGLAIIHGESAKICLFNEGGHFIANEVNEELANRHRKGGQSQRRHERNYDIIVNVYLDFVVDAIKSVYLDNGLPCVGGIIVAGTSTKRFDVIKKLPKTLQTLIFHEMTVSSQNITPLEILNANADKFIRMCELQIEQDIWDNWIQHITLDTGKAIYGKKEVTKSLANGSLKSIVINKQMFNKKREQIQKIAKKVGCVIHIISNISGPGRSLMHNYGGVVGIKWY